MNEKPVYHHLSSLEQGFTLIETMVTLVILAVGLLALGTFYISMIDRQQVAQERMIAVHLAEQVMEFWQHDANDYVPSIDPLDCGLSAGTSQSPNPPPGPPPGFPCTYASLVVTYTILPSISQARAPLPTNPNNGGDPLVSPNPGTFPIRNMQAVVVDTPTPHKSVTPMLKVVKVSWTHKGKDQNPIVLTHIACLK